MPNGVKKWFMLQVWRVQQIATILSLVMLAVTDALLVYDKASWRSGVFESPYTGVVIILLAIGLIIWGVSIVWDLKLKMWREQMTVLTEKNPYLREKMNTKELVLYQLSWLPVLEGLGKNDPQARESAETLKLWMQKVMGEDPSLSADVKDVFEYLGRPLPDHMKTDRK